MILAPKFETATDRVTHLFTRLKSRGSTASNDNDTLIFLEILHCILLIADIDQSIVKVIFRYAMSLVSTMLTQTQYY